MATKGAKVERNSVATNHTKSNMKQKRKAYPNQLSTVVLKGDAKQLAEGIDGKTISVTRTVIDYKGKPEIVVADNANIQFEHSGQHKVGQSGKKGG